MELDFIVAGYSKCGTTTLCSMLMSHPQLFIPPRFKEPRFFIDEAYKLRWQWFSNLFHEASADMLLGEGTVAYSEYEFAEDCCQRIKKTFPSIRIMLIARDPIDRLESSFREMHSSGPDWAVECPFDIKDALLDLPNMLNDTQYFEILSIYQRYFQAEQLLVLFQEELKANPQDVLERCFNFLGVDPKPVILLQDRQLNQATDKYYDTEALRALRNLKLHPEGTPHLREIPTYLQNQFLPQLNLRKPFQKKKLHWSKEAKELVIRKLGSGPERFLQAQGKDLRFWPRYRSFLKGV